MPSRIHRSAPRRKTGAYRSAVTGKFVKSSTARRHPNKTVKES